MNIDSQEVRLLVGNTATAENLALAGMLMQAILYNVQSFTLKVKCCMPSLNMLKSLKKQNKAEVRSQRALL